MKVIVTGVAGYIGSNVTEYLLDKGYEVVGIDNFNDYYDPKIKEFNIASFKNNPSFKLYREDISDRKAMEEIFAKEKDVKAIVHLAAWAGVTYSIKNPYMYAETNYVGTENLAGLGVKAGVKKFIFASSSSIYGENNKSPFKEEMDTSLSIAPYPASKKGGEALLHSYHHNSGLDVVIFRFFNPVGPRLRPDLALAKLIRCALYGYTFYVYQDPESSKRDYTYITNMCDAVEKAINKDMGYEIINLGNSKPVSINELKTAVEKMVGKEIKTENDYRPGQMDETCADITKAGELLDYKPKESLEEMILLYLDWFKKQPEWYRKYKVGKN